MRSSSGLAGPSLATRFGLLRADPAPVVFTPRGIWDGFVADFSARKEIMGNIGPVFEAAPKAVRQGYSTMMSAATDFESAIGMF